MKLPDNSYNFTNVGSNPATWTAVVTGDVLDSSLYGTFVWSEDEQCYINNTPTEPEEADIQRLYVYPNGNFAIISLPIGCPQVVGDWL